MPAQVRPAAAHDLDAVAEGYLALLRHEEVYGSTTNWKPGIYPTLATAERALAKGWLHILEDRGLVCASVILNDHQAPEYDDIPWAFPAERNEVLVVHTLCIQPIYQRMGYGRKIMQYALDLARKRDCKAVRLDTFDGNTAAAAFYSSLGFRHAGTADAVLEGLIPEPLKFFEYDLR